MDFAGWTRGRREDTPISWGTEQVIEKARLNATVQGRVQGVFFRAFVEEHSLSLALAGYAKNLPGGQVRVVAEGERGHLERLLQLLHQGPPGAKVEGVDFRWEEYQGNFHDFTIRY